MDNGWQMKTRFNEAAHIVLQCQLPEQQRKLIELIRNLTDSMDRIEKLLSKVLTGSSRYEKRSVKANDRDPSHDEPDLISVVDAAKRCGVGRSTIQQWYISGQVRSVKIGRARRIIYQSLRDHVAKLEKGTLS